MLPAYRFTTDQYRYSTNVRSPYSNCNVSKSVIDGFLTTLGCWPISSNSQFWHHQVGVDQVYRTGICLQLMRLFKNFQHRRLYRTWLSRVLVPCSENCPNGQSCLFERTFVSIFSLLNLCCVFVRIFCALPTSYFAAGKALYTHCIQCFHHHSYVAISLKPS